MSIERILTRIEDRLELLEQLLTEKADDVLDVDAVHALTGLSKSAIYQKTCSRNGEPPELPHYKQGKRLYFRRSEIVRWLTQNRVKDRAQIDRDASEYSAARRAGGRL